MALIINTNHPSLTAQRNLTNNTNKLDTPMQRLSSGKRINSAKDDAAGLAIVARFTTQILGSGQAIRNTSDGISLAQTADGAMQEVTNNLQRMRQLSVQSANATLSTSDRQSLQNEYQSLQAEIGRVANSTDFNGVKVIGSSATLNFQVGPNAASTNQIAVSTTNLNTNATVQTALTSVNINTATAAVSSLGAIDNALNAVSQIRSTFGTLQNRFASTIRSTENTDVNLSAARSRIQDTNYAQATANLTRGLILQHAGLATLAQANASPQRVLSLLNG